LTHQKLLPWSAVTWRVWLWPPARFQPLSKVEIKSKASGIVKKLYVDYGERVKQGQLLAELDKVQLEAAQRASRANLQAAEAALDSSKATLERNKVDAEGLMCRSSNSIWSAPNRCTKTA